MNLPDVRDEDNPIIWCERCGKPHRYYTFTRQDFDNIIARQAHLLAEAIDADILAKMMTFNG